MSNILFENIAAQIAAGTITAHEILDNICEDLSAPERQALLNSLADKAVSDGVALRLASVQSGVLSGSDTLVVPAFLSGSFTVIDTDGSGTIDLEGTNQFAYDSTGGMYPEETAMHWNNIPGEYFAGRTFTIPTGVTVLYAFTLKN